MTGINRKIRGAEYRSTVVCIDSYDRHILSGRFYTALRSEGVPFASLMEFLLKMEQGLDAQDFPQAFSAVRTFGTPAARHTGPPPGGGAAEGALATFEIRLLFRQNASWQGCITWLEGGREESFRSVLELSMLMDSALTGTAETSA